ncbi:hypothetical protein BESB_036310 [Besnoitia besnoiti]|uniref:Uncharacterized protein n=1 Tax=Besnoitia besnoiti TaxID=94643 RepID=A0A2A9MMW6_BESBE|nr:hypothetical protein BESB_036310 [Besnoitia besnoiti]PFH37173.1 hypothetical protein BESB_036310 [Besnoitia besnoiti]
MDYQAYYSLRQRPRGGGRLVEEHAYLMSMASHAPAVFVNVEFHKRRVVLLAVALWREVSKEEALIVDKFATTSCRDVKIIQSLLFVSATGSNEADREPTSISGPVGKLKPEYPHLAWHLKIAAVTPVLQPKTAICKLAPAYPQGRIRNSEAYP